MKAEQEDLLNRLSQLKRRYFAKRQKELRQHQMEMELGSFEYEMRGMGRVNENADAAAYHSAPDGSGYDYTSPMPGTIDHFAPPTSDGAPGEAALLGGAEMESHPFPPEEAEDGFEYGGVGGGEDGGGSLGDTIDFLPEEQ